MKRKRNKTRRGGKTPTNPFASSQQVELNPKQLAPFILTNKLRSLVVGLLIVAGVGYLVLQFVLSTLKPSLQISNYDGQPIVSSSEVSFIEGSVSAESTLSINDVDVIINSEGRFKSRVVLQSGLNTFSVVARNQLDRQNEKIVQIIYQAP